MFFLLDVDGNVDFEYTDHGAIKATCKARYQHDEDKTGS